MNNFTKYSGVLVFIIIALIIAGVYFFWWPQYRDYVENSRIFEAKTKDVKIKMDYLTELDSKAKALSDYEADFSKIVSSLPVGLSEITLFSFMQKIASENSMVLNDLTFGSSSGSPGENISEIREFNFDAMLSGTYDSFKKLLSALYFSSRMIEVISINFISPEKGGAYDFDLSLVAKYYDSK